MAIISTKQGSLTLAERGKGSSDVILHIPHAATSFPDAYKEGLLISEEELRDEIVFEADLYCDEIFASDGILTIAEWYAMLRDFGTSGWSLTHCKVKVFFTHIRCLGKGFALTILT